MSHGVHIQVTIPTSEPDRLKSIASDAFGEEWGGRLIDDRNAHEFVPGATESYEFLNDLREGRAYFKWGNEGDIALWGMVVNHGEPTRFAEILLPFWQRLFSLEDQIITHDWQHVLILYTHECKEPSSGIIEVGWPSEEMIGTEVKITHTNNAKFTCL
ncbi:MAG: hypothetical protein KDN19_06975 [Verrucomicrobiae bacterium]|nr:hypothetical protein [Verrucomicrobiae bacterium]